MIDFATLQGLTIPDGVVTQVEDAAGNVLWSASKPVILKVEKITSDTYAGETTYTGEEFILFDIYPKSGGTVNVTYGGLTKTITDDGTSEEPNAQQVFFGTFNGVSDEVETPASGELTIEGGCATFAIGTFKSYSNDKEINKYCSCVTEVSEWGSITSIGNHAFYECTGITSISIPNSITSIGNHAFDGCTNMVLNSLPASLITIGNYAFENCYKVNVREFPPNLASIGIEAFYIDTGLDSEITSHAMYNATIILPNTIQSIGDSAFRTKDEYLAGEYMYYTYIAGVKIHATTPPTIGEDTFGTYGMSHCLENSMGKVTAEVPTGCGEAYKAAQYWKSLNIVEES